jgi:hypothetical protein
MRVETHNMKIKHLNNIKKSILISSIVSLAMVFCLQIFSTNVNAAKYIFDMVPLKSRFPQSEFHESQNLGLIQFDPTGSAQDLVNFNPGDLNNRILNYVLPANAAECKAKITSLSVKSAVAKTPTAQSFYAYASARTVGSINGVDHVMAYYYPLYQLNVNSDASAQGLVIDSLIYRGEFNDPSIANTNFDGGIKADVKIGEFTMGQAPNLVTIPSLSGDISRFNFVVMVSQGEFGNTTDQATVTVTRPTVEIDFDENSDISKCSFMSSNTTTTNTTPPATPGMGSSSGATENQVPASSSSNIKAPKTGALLVSLILIPIIVAGSAYLYIAHHNQAGIKKNSER